MMQCPSCNGFRPANNAPCPLCNAPSPLITEAWNGQNSGFAGAQQAAWGGSGVQQNDWSGSSSGQMPFPSFPSNFSGSGAFSQPNAGGSGTFAQAPFGGSGVQQMAFPSGQQPFVQPSEGSDNNSFWSQNMASREAARGSSGQKQQSLLPVPFQPQPDSNAQAFSMLPTAFPTIGPGIPQVNSMVPALPDTEQEAPVYVPPMYTKPRPIIPRYRAVSGLISFIIVVALLCGGAGYYAQVTGRLAFIEKLFGTYTPPPQTVNHQMLQVPSNQVVQGPAANVVYSVGISNKVDSNTGIIPVQINQFTVNEMIWLVCSVKPPKDGQLTVKWYDNNTFYKSDSHPITHDKGLQTGIFPIRYGLPTEGKVEVYWNDQLAATVLFVVQPSAS